MLKFRKDGSDTDSSTKICWVYLWPYLANPIYPFCDFLLPMKHSIRPFFSILLLLVFAASLCLKTLVRRSNPLSKGFDNNALFQTPPKPVFNSTLLKYASIDLGEAKLKQEIENLLEGNFDSLGRYRTFASWRRVNGRDIRSKTSNGLPLSLRSPSFYRSWLNFSRVLHNWERNKRFQQEIMSELINLVKHPIDKHNGLVGSSSNQRYKSCAVVGNSGILLKTGYGKVIDNNEIVIRLNNARIEKYESKVGSKTNISFVNSNILHLCGRREGCFCHPYGENVPMVMYICQPLHLLDYIVCNGSQKAPLIITDARFDVLCGRIVKYYSLKRFVEQTGKSFEEWGPTHDGSMFHYSSGMQAIMLALGICDKVSVFGFGKSDSAKHHYHTNQKAELHLHDYEAEYDFYKDLVERPQVIPFIPESFKIPPLVVYK